MVGIMIVLGLVLFILKTSLLEGLFIDISSELTDTVYVFYILRLKN